MAWATPPMAVAGGAVNAADFNTFVRDNLPLTMPGLATVPGSHFATTGSQALAQRTTTMDEVLVQESTSSTTYTNLATVGPQVVVNCGTRVLVIFGGYIGGTSSAGASARMGWTAAGAHTLAADDVRCFGKIGGTTDLWIYGSSYSLFTGWTPGSTTFTAKYRVGSGSGSFHVRRLTVISF